MSPWSYEERVAWAEACALLRVRCPWCEPVRWLRPCNLSRHIAAAHFKQLTIYDALGDPEKGKAA